MCMCTLYNLYLCCAHGKTNHCAEERQWLSGFACNHTQLCSPPAETTERGLVMNQTRNKKNETIMNQRIISAERALFLSSSSGSWSISQPINQSCRRGCFCVTVGVTWQPVPFSVTSRIAIRGGRWSKETEFENLLSTLPSTCQWSPSS